MAVLSKLALRPDYPYASDRPTVYVIEGETFVAFGSMTPEQFWDGVGRRRFEHPSFKEFSLFLDYATPDLPQDPYIPLDSSFEDDPEQDPIEFVLNDNDEMHIYESPEGTYRIKLDWKDNYYFVLQRKLDKCNLAILDQYPRKAVPPGGHKLAMGTSERDLLEIRTLHRSRRHAEDILWKLKGVARNNLGLLNYLTHTLTWWQEALEEDDCAFVRSLNLPLRPKQGCLVNPLSDWSFLNIPLLRQHDVPFAYVWSEAVNAQPRFARLDPKFVQGYYQVKEELGREPRPEEIPVIASGDRDALYFDHLLQDKRKRTKGSMACDYQPGSSYVLQMHEGWKGVELDDPAAIQRCLDRYEHYAERSTNGEERVVIEAWSLRDSDEQSVHLLQ